MNKCEHSPDGEHFFVPDLDNPEGQTSCCNCGITLDEFQGNQLKLEFFTAGKAIFTVQCPDGKHYTYKIKKAKPKKDARGKEYPPIFFVSLLTGPDNTSDYTYMGTMSQTGEVRLTSKSKYTEDTFAFRLIQRTMAVIWADEQEKMTAKGYKVHHEGRCGRCGRRLTVPESILSGIGPECAKRV